MDYHLDRQTPPLLPPLAPHCPPSRPPPLCVRQGTAEWWKHVLGAEYGGRPPAVHWSSPDNHIAHDGATHDGATHGAAHGAVHGDSAWMNSFKRLIGGAAGGAHGSAGAHGCTGAPGGASPDSSPSFLKRVGAVVSEGAAVGASASGSFKKWVGGAASAVSSVVSGAVSGAMGGSFKKATATRRGDAGKGRRHRHRRTSGGQRGSSSGNTRAVNVHSSSGNTRADGAGGAGGGDDGDEGEGGEGDGEGEGGEGGGDASSEGPTPDRLHTPHRLHSGGGSGHHRRRPKRQTSHSSEEGTRQTSQHGSEEGKDRRSRSKRSDARGHANGRHR